MVNVSCAPDDELELAGNRAQPPETQAAATAAPTTAQIRQRDNAIMDFIIAPPERTG
jgi:hypothetical protein